MPLSARHLKQTQRPSEVRHKCTAVFFCPCIRKKPRSTHDSLAWIDLGLVALSSMRYFARAATVAVRVLVQPNVLRVYRLNSKKRKTLRKGKGPSGPVEAKEGPEGPSLRPAPLGGGRALRERGVPSSRGLAPQYFGRWRA